MTTTTATARIEYRALRSACARHTATRFDDIARHIALELSDGEDVTPALWVHAAHIILSGQDHA